MEHRHARALTISRRRFLALAGSFVIAAGMVGTLGGLAGPANAASLRRKNQASLTPGERAAFVNALIELKNAVPSRLGLTNRYDDYVQWHLDAMMASPGYAHGCPVFLPWHREFLRRFELDLQAVDPTVTIPYWDWTVDRSPDPTVAGSPWTEDFMGGDGDPTASGRVRTGPFAFDAGLWRINIRMSYDPDFLARALANSNAPTLPTAANVTGALQVVPYDAAPWDATAQPSFRNRIEGGYGAGSVHNRVHRWVGGAMDTMASPNDPIFWLHHAMIDRLWAQWQALQPSEPYQPANDSPTGPISMRFGDPMRPWGSTTTPHSVMDHLALGYYYDDEPVPEPTPTHTPTPTATPTIRLATATPTATPSATRTAVAPPPTPTATLTLTPTVTATATPTTTPAVTPVTPTPTTTPHLPGKAFLPFLATGPEGPVAETPMASMHASPFPLSPEDVRAPGGHDLGTGH